MEVLMKQKKSVIDARRRKIIQHIHERGYTSVEKLARLFDISEPTVRRDLTAIEKLGLIVRVHGGAQAAPSEHRIASLLEQKRSAIAKTAASLVHDEDILFVNSSLTALETLQYIEPNKFVTVITNNGKAIEKNTPPNIKLMLTGGETRPPKSAMTGEFATNNLTRVQATKSILGASGLDLTEGITTAIIDEVAINKLMLSDNYSKCKILLVDSSKLDHVNAFVSGSLKDIDTLITDSDADPSFVQAIKDLGITVILAHTDDLTS